MKPLIVSIWNNKFDNSKEFSFFFSFSLCSFVFVTVVKYLLSSRLCFLFALFLIPLKCSHRKHHHQISKEQFTMIKSGSILRQCQKQNLLIQNLVREKSIIQWYNHFWSKFDDPIVKPPYKHCTQIGMSKMCAVAIYLSTGKLRVITLLNYRWSNFTAQSSRGSARQDKEQRNCQSNQTNETSVTQI